MKKLVMLYILPVSIFTHLVMNESLRKEILSHIRILLESNILMITDHEPPNLELKELTIIKDTPYSLSDFIENCNDNSKRSCILTYQNQEMESYQEVGTYNISIAAKDPFYNQIIKQTKLTIIPPLVPNQTTVKSKENYSIVQEEPTLIEEKLSQTYANIDIEKESAKREEILQLINTYRKARGLNPLILSNRLNIAATIRSQEMADNNLLSHTRPNGTECFSIFEELKIQATLMGENIANGYQTATGVFNAWKNSKTHNANIIKENYQYTGIGIVNQNGNYYWTQLFSNIE